VKGDYIKIAIGYQLSASSNFFSLLAVRYSLFVIPELQLEYPGEIKPHNITAVLPNVY
jgi:hypothetical protein